MDLFNLLKQNRVVRLRLQGFIFLSLLAAQAGFGQGTSLFYNNDNYTYPGNGTAQLGSVTNVYNDFGGTFSMNISANGVSWASGLYYGWSQTLTFTNLGEMDSTSGFIFAQKNPGTTPATTFYNAGNINCGTGINAVTIVTGLGTSVGINIFGFGGIYAYATNIINNGTITVGGGGLGRFSGQNIDFTRGTLQMENGLIGSGLGQQTNTASISAIGEVRHSTNNWAPDTELTQFSATSAPLALALGLPLSLATTPYFSVDSDATGTNIVVRMVFIENFNTNVNYGVYFGGASGFGGGFTTIQWAGTYFDPTTDQIATNYLYLNDDYVTGSSTNILNYPGGVPANYTFLESPVPLTLGTPTASSFPSLFPTGPFPAGVEVSNNIYSFVDADLLATTVPLSSVANGALTNLPGRFEITASNELNLSLASMSGMNYVSLRSTNNIDYDGQSLISAPYSDIYIGRTNNNLAVTNLILPSVPIWSGEVAAWNTRWFYTNTATGITYDYRVMIVGSDVFPITESQQQDFVLYSSNNVTISDTLNILRTFYSNGTNLLVTTNQGAASQDGELNLDSPNIVWQNSTPRLRNLTNNGAIRTMTMATYGTQALPYFALVNSGTISNGNGSFIHAGDFENSGFFSAGSGTFSVQSLTTSLTNGVITAGGAFTNVSDSLIASNTSIQVGRGMTFIVTNFFSDGGVGSNYWSLGTSNSGAGIAPGLVMTIKPAVGDLLGTTITNIATAGTQVNDIWAGQDLGAVNAGFSNNAAIGQLILDAKGSSPRTGFYFGGIGASNAIYVDQLVLEEFATNVDGNYNVTTLTFNTNLVIYYAQAVENGISLAEKLNGQNNGHLRWVPTYAGTYSSTNLVAPPGITNLVNIALAQDPNIDSDGDGLANSVDPVPFFVPSLLNFNLTTTNLPPKSVKVQWQTIPNATNYVYYTTNLSSPWMPFTNFVNYYSANTIAANTNHVNWFITPQSYPSPAGNVWVFDTIANTPHFYQVKVQPWLTYPN